VTSPPKKEESKRKATEINHSIGPAQFIQILIFPSLPLSLSLSLSKPLLQQTAVMDHTAQPLLICYPTPWSSAIKRTC